MIYPHPLPIFINCVLFVKYFKLPPLRHIEFRIRLHPPPFNTTRKLVLLKHLSSSATTSYFRLHPVNRLYVIRSSFSSLAPLLNVMYRLLLSIFPFFILFSTSLLLWHFIFRYKHSSCTSHHSIHCGSHPTSCNSPSCLITSPHPSPIILLLLLPVCEAESLLSHQALRSLFKLKH